MKLSGTSRLSAERAAVFDALNDPAILVRSIPGCQRLEALGADTYKMTVAAGVGSIKGVYDGQVHLSDVQHPETFRMHARGAGAPGTIGAEVLITLVEHADGGTHLSYDADATVGGMIGGVGQRMLTGVAKKMANEFFTNVDTVLGGAAAPGAGAGAAVEAGSGGGPGTGVDGTGRRATEERGWMPGAGPPQEPVGTAPAAGRAAATPGQVFTSPAAARTESAGAQGFKLGATVGAAAALAGALVGGWIASRKRG
jgi:carbon monoxide dehydrogenase subunit G